MKPTSAGPQMDIVINHVTLLQHTFALTLGVYGLEDDMRLKEESTPTAVHQVAQASQWRRRRSTALDLGQAAIHRSSP